MFNIFICDDNVIHLQQIKDCIEKYVVIEDIPVSKIYAETSPYDILAHVQDNGDSIGLYFIDLSLNCDMDGCELAVKVREHDPWGSIVIVTADPYSQRLLLERKIEMLSYIYKGDFLKVNDEIRACVKTAYLKLTKKEVSHVGKFPIKLTKDSINTDGRSTYSNGSILPVDIRHIMYFETYTHSKNTIAMHTSQGTHHFRGFISDVIKKLDQNCFLKCNRSYIINLENIKIIDPILSKIIFVNDLEVELNFKLISKISKILH